MLNNLTKLIKLELDLTNNLIENNAEIIIENNISKLNKLTSLELDFGNNNIIGE